MPKKSAKARTAPKPIGWQPARWGADVAAAFTKVAQGFRTGDRMQFTRNNYRADRLNGHIAEVVAIDPAGSSMVVEREDGRRDMLDLHHLADRHIRPGWVRTITSAQGTKCDRVMAHLESFRANTVDANIAYVAVSRAKASAIIYTDDRDRLASAIEGRSSAKVGVIDETLVRKGAAIAIPKPIRTMGVAIG